jgi:hypothetical protein
MSACVVPKKILYLVGVWEESLILGKRDAVTLVPIIDDGVGPTVDHISEGMIAHLQISYQAVMEKPS